MIVELVWLPQPGYYRLRVSIGLDRTSLELAGEMTLLPAIAPLVREGWAMLAAPDDWLELVDVGWVAPAEVEAMVPACR